MTTNDKYQQPNIINFYGETTKKAPYYSRLYHIFNDKNFYSKPEESRRLTFPLSTFEPLETNSQKQYLHTSDFSFQPLNKNLDFSITDISRLELHENRQPDIEIFVFNASKTTRTLAKNLIGYAVQDVSFENDTVSRYHVNDVESCLFLYDAVYTNGQNYRDYVDFDLEQVNHVATDTLTPEPLTKYAKRPYFECPRDISFLQPDDKSFIEMFDWKNQPTLHNG